MTQHKYRGYRRCSLIDYANGGNAFEITICVKPRRKVFCTTSNNQLIVAELKRLQDDGYWGVYAYCIMPDHIHLVVSPGVHGLSQAVKYFKGRVSRWWRENGDGQSLWQRSYFDHRIRSSESFHEKCVYVLENPVRAGLEQDASKYPWSGSLTRR